MIIETERLRLREYTPEDFDALYEIISDPETMKHYPKPYDRNGTKRWLDWSLDNYRKYGFGLWAAELKETGEFIGDCGITMQIIDGKSLPEIGYHINKRHWRKGYAREAARAVRDWGFRNTEFDALYSYMNRSNEASCATARTNGMKKVKEFTGSDGIVYCAYAITRKEWEAISLPRIMAVNGTEYTLLKLLGHGKGGYSYLAERDGKQAVVKQIHHEPCDYYAFGNKIEAERRDYGKLKQAGIRIPAMIDIDTENERIVKEFIEGPVIYDMVRDGISVTPYLEQVRDMAEQARAAGLNIDYFPTNFVVRDGLIYYVDYECNAYMDEWSFGNWGVKYWAKTPEFEEYLRTHG